MKVLHVNKFLHRAGGSDAYALDVADLQRKQGHSVEFFAMAHPDNEQARYSSHFPSRVDFDPPPAGWGGKVRAGSRMMWSVSAARGIDAVIEDFEPDVAHLHGIYHQLSPSVLRPLAKWGVPIVMTLHDYKLVCPTYRLLDNGTICEACVGRKFHNAAVRRCRDGSLVSSAVMGTELALHTYLGAYRPVGLFLCPSQFLRDKMVEGRVFPDRLRHLPLFSATADAEPEGNRDAVVLYAGRLSGEKGVDVLISAMAGVTSARLDIAGAGPEEAALRKLAGEVAPGRVQFLGRLTKTEVARRLGSSAVMVLPARWYENQPMSILEAFGAGTPVITSRLGGAPELVDDGEDGLLVPPDDPVALATAIDQLLADPERARKMGLAGRSKVQAQFTPEVHLERLSALYAEATQAVTS